MRSPREAAASTNHEAAHRLVRSLVGVVDVAFRYGRDGRVEGVSVLPATGAHERQVRLNVASGLMAGFGIALDPAKVELVRTSEELRALEAASAPPPPPAPIAAQAPVPPARMANGNGAHAGNGTHGANGNGAHSANGNGAHSANGNGAHAGNGTGAGHAMNGASAPATPPARPVLKPRVPEGAVGLAARAFHALDEQNMRPPVPPVRPEVGPPPAPARAEQAPVPPAPASSRTADPWDAPEPAQVASQPGPRRVRLLDDDAADSSRDPSVRPFPAAPAAAVQPGEPAPAPAPQPQRPAAAYVGSGRGGAAAALALPLEPAPMAAPKAVSAGTPRLEVAEVVAARGATFCRVVVEVDGERFTGVAEAGPELDRDQGMIDLVSRITVDALRSARVPRDPTQFHGASTVLVAGKPFVVAVLRCWNGRGFDDLCAVEAINDSPEEAAALAVLKAAASRMA